MEELIVFLKENYPMSSEDIEKLRDIVCSFSYKKGEILLNEGNISSKIYFISNGIMRTYYTDYDKKDIIEFTRRIYFKNDFCCNWESFRHQRKSKEYIECIEDTKGVLYF